MLVDLYYFVILYTSVRAYTLLSLSVVLGIKGVHYIGSVQLLLAIWKNNKKG